MKSKPTAVDLFCGAGGAGRGLHQAGFDVVAGADHDETALQTYNENLSGEPIYHDLRDVDPSLLPEKARSPDFLHGSPPCQGFSQAKGERDPDDERNQLVWKFVDWARALSPTVVTMENVAGMQSISSTWMDRLEGEFRRAGYQSKWRLLNAADYGIPQTRERIFVVAVRNDQPTPNQWFPQSTHSEVATGTLNGNSLKKWPTVREAIDDLAPIDAGDVMTSHQNEKHQKEGRRDYHPVDAPAKTVRTGTPPELFAGKGPVNHVAQDHEPQTQQRLASLQLGETGEGQSNRRLHPAEPSPTITADEGAAVPPVHYRGPVNHEPTDHSDKAQATMAEMPHGFTGASVTTRRLSPEEPAGTITSQRTQAVHYAGPTPNHQPSGRTRADLQQAASEPEGSIRRLTVREAARLQSFPDTHYFVGTKTEQLEQVGNAVPPKLMYHIANHLSTELEMPELEDK